nr:acetyl-CoA carboxylase carboxyltransferase beta subunit [Acalypha australis]
MEKQGFNSILSNVELRYRCRLSQSMENFSPLENTSVSEDPILNDNDIEHKALIWSRSSRYSNVSILVGARDTRNDETFLVKTRDGDIYFMYFDVENHVFEITTDLSFLSKSEIESHFGGSSNSDHFMYNTKYSWKNYITSYIFNYLRSPVSSILSSSNNSRESSMSSSSLRTSTNGSNLTIRKSSNDLDITKRYKHLWIQCENCYALNYKKFLKSRMNICEECGYHLKMRSSDRIELSIDLGTWDPIDEDMVSLDPLAFHSEEEPYKDRIYSYQRKTGLTEAVQTGTGQLNGIPVAIGVMDFQFMGGSMGSVVGEKITRLIEYATNQFLPLILVCASGGARMQEGSLSLMQMAKISSALYDYQSNKKLFYVSILTSPTTGGVTASFAMLGDIIIAEPNTYIAFAGKRVIEQTLNKTVSEDSQSAEFLFHKGLFDSIVPRNLLKGVLNELLQLHDFFPLNHK